MLLAAGRAASALLSANLAALHAVRPLAFCALGPECPAPPVVACGSTLKLLLVIAWLHTVLAADDNTNHLAI